MRINQFVAAASGLSRRAADAAIAAGRVHLDGQVAVLGQTVTPGDQLTLDSQPLQLPKQSTYLMFHKPAGYVTSRARQGTDPTIYELLPAEFHHLRPVGRLDRDSSGLLLLTNDGHFIQRYTHPSHQKAKIYELHLDHALTTAHRHQLEQGIELSDGPSHVHVLTASGPDVTVDLREGRNRQLRRTFGALGYGVVRLHRIQAGDYHLGDLAPGQWQTLNPSPAETAT